MRRITALILIMTILTGLISCTKEVADDTIYTSEYIGLSGVTLSDNGADSVFLDYDGNIFLPVLAETSDERIDRGENNSLLCLSYDRAEEITSVSASANSRNMTIENVCGTKDGGIVGIFRELYFADEKYTDPMTGEEQDGITFSQVFFEKFSPDGEVIFRSDFSFDNDDPRSGLNYRNGQMIADDEGYIFFRNNNDGKLFVFSPDGEFLFTLDPPSESQSFSADQLYRDDGGKVRYLYSGDREEHLSVAIDINGRCCGEETPFTKIAYGDEKLLVSVTGEPFVYDSYGLYSMVGGEKTELFSWSSVAVDGTALREIVIRSAEDITVCTQDEDGYLYARITKVNGSEVPEIVTLNLAIDTSVDTRMLESFTKAAAIFNRTERNYRIELIEYTSDEGGFTAGQKLARDISSGKRIDMVAFLGDLSYELLEKNDMFVDLYPLIDADPEISRDDLLPCVTSAAEASDGGLYRFICSFSVSTMFMRPEYADSIGECNVDAMKRLNDSLEDDEYLISLYQTSDQAEMLFTIIMPYMLSEFIDYETRECDFTGLAELLETCRGAEIGTYEQEGADNSVLYLNALSDTGSFIFTRTLKEDAVDVGYPVSVGNGSFVIPVDSMSITKFCPAPDAAWRFCLSMVGFQKKLCAYDDVGKTYKPTAWMPCTRENLDLLIDNYKHYYHIIEYFTQTDIGGVEHSGYHSKYINKNNIIAPDVTPLSPTDADFAAMKAMIYRADSIKPDDKVSLSIILEEASAYFSGIRSAEETVKLISDRVGTRITE